MQELSLEEIRTRALAFHKSGERWHFHILNPDCRFNTKKEFAFVLEGPDETQRFIHYSTDSPSDLGKELAPLAHKAKVLDNGTTDTGYMPSATMQKVLDRARELTAQNIRWHHHVISSRCQFHSGGANYTFIFEDPETGESIEQTSDEQPINDLKQIEPLFYSQK